MTHKRTIFIIVVISCILFVACKQEEKQQENLKDDRENTILEKPDVQEEEEVKKYTLLSREYLYETYGITDEDLEGIEFEYFVERGPIGESSYDLNDSKEYIIQTFRDDQAALDKERLRIENDKTYLLNGPAFEGEMPDFDTLIYLSVEVDAMADDADKMSRFVDFKKKIYYFSGAISLVPDLERAFEPKELDDKEIESFLSFLEKLDIDSWEYMYDEEGRSRYFNWEMGLEFESGEVITIHGTLNEEGGYPEGFRPLLERFQDLKR